MRSILSTEQRCEGRESKIEFRSSRRRVIVLVRSYDKVGIVGEMLKEVGRIERERFE